MDSELSVLKGIGPRKASILKSAGIVTVYDLLSYFPRLYEDQSNITPIAHLQVGEKQTVFGTITGVSERYGGSRNMLITTAIVEDNSGAIQATWFNKKFLTKQLKAGKRLFATGKISWAYGGQGQMNMSQIKEFQILDSDEEASANSRVLPIYKTIGNLNQNFFRQVIEQALFKKDNDIAVSYAIREYLSDEFRRKYNLMPREDAFREMHYPSNMRLQKFAKYRMAFDELYLIQCGLMILKKMSRDKKEGFKHKKDGELIKALLTDLPFELTGDQKKAWKEICADMEADTPMRRLVQGDVGSGKTIVALLALLKTVESGHQGAMMAPTEILATQHFEGFQHLLKNMDVRVELLSGKLTKKKKEAVYERLLKHEIDIIVGTHALIQEGVKFADLGLVVTDEQHRFGIEQRAMLEQKGDLMPDALVMTATPIPRTMTLTVYGDLDVSLIKQMPPGRKQIRTFVRTPDRRHLIYKFMREQIEAGRQGYVVCPLVEASETSDLPSAEEIFEELINGIFYGVPCGLVHGKMKPKEKDKIMEAFHQGEIKLLVATTVIEVGVNVPNASMMVVENAECFGLAQLHQLRGRIGRGEYASYCVLVTSQKTENAKERMTIMESTADGFVLAEEDLRLRGPGQFFGSMQHGLPDLKAVDVLEDIDILLKAREAAVETMNNAELQRNVRPILASQYREQFFNITIN